VNDTEQFLSKLFGDTPDTGHISIFTLPDTVARRFTDCSSAADYALAQCHSKNVYVGCGLVRHDLSGTGRGTTDDVTAIPGFWQDLDCAMPYRKGDKQLFPSLPAALDFVLSLPLQPSILVDSGGGIHMWWLFREPWVFDTALERERARNLARDWAATIRVFAGRKGYADSIDATHDLAHILRLPGTLNHKAAPPSAVTILGQNEQRFNISDFEESLVAADPEPPKHSSTIDAEIDTERARAALSRLAASRRDNYDAWLRTGFALTELGANGLGLWEDWSRGSAKYKSGECSAKWAGFVPGDEKYKGITLASLFHWANEDDTSGAHHLPRIFVSGTPLRTITAKSVAALEAANQPAQIFIRSGSLARIHMDEHGLPIIQEMSEAALRGHMERAAQYMRTDKQGKSGPIPPPIDVVQDLEALRSLPFPPLLGIIETPSIRPDGTLITTPGYDMATKLYYVPPETLDNQVNVPDVPDEVEQQEAISLLKEVLCDFPFDSLASAVNALAAMITPVLRPIIQGCVPMALIDKPQAGTGASLIAEVIALVATGRGSAMMTAPKDDESWRKGITAMLIEGRTVVTIDNVEGRLYSPSLAAILTAETWTDRILGRSETATVAHRATWIATGNNIRLGGDLPRRCYWVRMDAQQPRPWQRNGFLHTDLTTWVRDNRGRILSAILTLARAWIVAGRPLPTGMPSIGGFANWVNVVGGILVHAGMTDFLGNLESMYDQADDDTPQWEAFLAAWYSIWQDTPIIMSKLSREIETNADLEASLPDDLATEVSDDKGFRKVAKSFSRRMGKALAARAGMHFPSGTVLHKGKDPHANAVAWRVAVESCGFGGFGGFSFTPSQEKLRHISIWDRLETNPRNPRNPQKPAFVPSALEQEVPDGAVLPPGGTYRMDMATGKNYARWPGMGAGEELSEGQRSYLEQAEEGEGG
jgi:hypothetical protein